MSQAFKIIIIGSISLFFGSCNRDPLAVNTDEIDVSVTTRRFEQDLFKGTYANELKLTESLREKYGTFFDLFVFKILNIPESNDSVTASNLTKFVTDQEVKEIFRLTDSVFTSATEINSGMESFLKHHKFYFPEKPVPGVVTFISAFNYAVITTDSVIGIGLDMFLGSQVEYYARLGIPKYLFNKFSKDYIVPSAIKAWYQSDYDVSEVKNEFLSQMIYQGKMMYYINAMAPDLHDTLRSGYSASQLKWCEENEGNMWSFFIENKLLFNTDPSEYAKFVNDGPATNGFPKEAPGRIGVWMGWQIVKEYMKQNSDVTLQNLLEEKDAQKILEQSGYKPKK